MVMVGVEKGLNWGIALFQVVHKEWSKAMK